MELVGFQFVSYHLKTKVGVNYVVARCCVKTGIGKEK